MDAANANEEAARPTLNLKWRKITSTTGPAPQARHGHKAVAIKELVIIFGGGNDGIMDTLHVLNTGERERKWRTKWLTRDDNDLVAGLMCVSRNMRICCTVFLFLVCYQPPTSGLHPK